jgi:hypothetical protein
MRHEKIIRRDDGSKVKIEVELSVELYSQDIRWDFKTYKCLKGKRTWETAVDLFSRELRRLSTHQKRERALQLKLQLATKEEVETAMLELLAQIKPEVS